MLDTQFVFTDGPYGDALQAFCWWSVYLKVKVYYKVIFIKKKRNKKKKKKKRKGITI